jgi:hypothetical protein
VELVGLDVEIGAGAAVGEGEGDLVEDGGESGSGELLAQGNFSPSSAGVSPFSGAKAAM